MSFELWKPIPTLEGYEASSEGRIRGPRDLHTLTIRPDGYVQVSIRNRLYGVHRLVCIAFHGLPPYPSAVARHKDHNTGNNCYENIEWGTHQDNMDDMIAAGRQANTKLNWDIVNTLRQRYCNGESQSSLAVEFGIGQSRCSNIVLNKGWYDPNYSPPNLLQRRQLHRFHSGQRLHT